MQQRRCCFAEAGGFAAAEVLLCSGWRICGDRGAALQRLAALQRPGCGFAAAGGFAAAWVRLCSGWRLCSGGGCGFAAAGGFAAAEAAALQQLAALQLLEERKRSALPERVTLRQRKVVVAGETAPLGEGQRMLHRTTRRTLQSCVGAQPFLLMNVKAA